MADNRFCKFCGAQIPTESQFCLKCGATLKQITTDNKFCGKCGANIPTESQFCLKCGATLPAEKEQVYVVRKAIYPRAAEGVPHWTKPEWAALAWFLGSCVLFFIAQALQNDSLTNVAGTSIVLSFFVGFLVFVGTEVYLNRRDR